MAEEKTAMSTTLDEPDRDQGRSPVLIAAVLAGLFLAWGLFLYFMVGSPLPPSWDFGAIPDVPGLSVYATNAPRPLPGVPPSLHDNAELSVQHVNERPVVVPPMNREAAP